MAITVRLKHRLDSFVLNIQFTSSSKRIGILGASGCGKSMTLKGIAGVQPVDEGYVAVENEVFFDSAQKINRKPQARKVGYLFQNYALFPRMTVKQNIMAGLHGKRAECEAQAQRMVEKFQLKGLENRLPAQLSGGQQQRTALARIMAYQPDVILLDEPFSALDGFLSDRLQQELLEMLEEYAGTVILVSHNRDEIYRFSEQLLVMENGEIITQGSTKDVFHDPKTKTAARLTGCKNIADIEPIDAEHYRIPAWNCTVSCHAGAYGDADAIGYRAHEFIPIWTQQQEETPENSIPFRLKSVAELPFERKYFLQGETGEEICWFVQRDQWKLLEQKGLPDFIQMKQEHILYLKEG